MRRLAIALAIGIASTSPARAQDAMMCVANAEVEVYRFLADRPLTATDVSIIRAEAGRHPQDATPQACRIAGEIHAKTLTADPVAKARLRAAMQTGYVLSIAPGDARLDLLQHYAPVVLVDRPHKLVMRRAALDAYFDTVRFVTSLYGEPAPADSIEHQLGLLRPKVSTMSPAVVQALTYQEARNEILKRDWAAQPAAWRRQILARSGGRSSDYDAVETSAGKVQEAIVERRVGAGDASAGQIVQVARHNAAIQATGLKVQALLGAVAAGRP